MRRACRSSRYLQWKSAYFVYSVVFWVHSLNIGFVNLCFYKQGLQIFSLFTIEKCVFSVFFSILGPQLEHRVCKFVFLHAGLADLGAMYNK